MYNERIEELIKAALADGELTEKEKQILFKNAQEQGIDLDEFGMVLEARLVELKKVQKEAAPKSNKYGDIRKCPACGALVPAFKGVCQECGFEFANVDANLSSKQLAEKLLKEDSDSKKIEIIETFPIPNSKADLLEFLTSLKPRVLGEYNQYTNAYFKKYQECIEKARIAFDGDKQLQSFIEGFSDLDKQFKLKKKSAKRQKKGENIFGTLGNVFSWLGILIVSFPKVSIVIAIIIAGLIISAVDNKEIHEFQKLQGEFENAFTQGDLNKAEQLLGKYAEYSTVESYREDAKRMIEAYVDNNDIDKAINIYKKTGEYYGHTRIIYQKLVDSELFEKAWMYSPDRYSDASDYIGNAKAYYKYMSDIVFNLCEKGRKTEAREFVNKYAIWFKKNVDNSEKKDEYKDYTYAAIKNKLLKIINEY